MGDEFIDTEYMERKEEDKAKFARWCEVLNWYISLKRAGFTPSFD
jgi:hypothetical protein